MTCEAYDFLITDGLTEVAKTDDEDVEIDQAPKSIGDIISKEELEELDPEDRILVINYWNSYFRSNELQNQQPELVDYNMSVFPNPFTENCKINITVPQEEMADIVILDMMGNKVADLASGAHLLVGENEFTFNRAGLLAGIYIAKYIDANAHVLVQQIIIE